MGHDLLGRHSYHGGGGQAAAHPRHFRAANVSALLAEALAGDRGRPRDDISIVVLTRGASDAGPLSIDGELRDVVPQMRAAKDIDDAAFAPE